jgi:hypothetical protein
MLQMFSRNGNGALRYGLLGPLPREEYDLLPALSCTVLKKWIACSSLPSKFAWWLKHRWEDQEVSAALALGGALDALLLEQASFADKFAVLSKDGPKRVTEAHRAQFAPKKVITYDQWLACSEMVTSLMTSPQTSHGEDFLFCKKNVAVTKLRDVPFKCEFDLWEENTEDIMDLKTTRDAGRESFARDAVNFGYDLQATLYLLIARALGFEKRAFNFVCVENVAPWTTTVYRFRPFANPKHREIYEGCEAILRAAIESLLEATSTKFEQDSRWEDLEFPAWALKNRSVAASVNLLA